jgi:hypothetical protein
VTSEFGNEEDNVENIDVVVSNDVPEASNPAEVTEVELLPQEDDGDLDDEEVLEDDIDDEDAVEGSDEDSEEESEDDSDGEFDDEDDEEFENADDDAQFTEVAGVAAAVAESVKQTVVIETLPITGEPRVDDALSRLSDLEGLPVHEHGDVFEDVRRRLHGTLSDLSGQ